MKMDVSTGHVLTTFWEPLIEEVADQAPAWLAALLPIDVSLDATDGEQTDAETPLGFV